MSEGLNRSEEAAAGGESTDSVDRIVLRRCENTRLHEWTTALNARFDGMIRVTKSDLANFLIRQHDDGLSECEIKLIEAELFDEVRWLNWALSKVRQAKKEGRKLSLNDLMVKRESIKSRNGTAPRAPRRRPRKPIVTGSTGDVPEVPDYAELDEG